MHTRSRPAFRFSAFIGCLVYASLICAGCAQHTTSLPSMSPVLTAAVAPAAPLNPREDMMDPIILKDALTNIDALEKTLDWKPFRPGVEISRIYTTPDSGPASAFLKYQPGAAVPLHMHGGYEHIFILKGSQVDRSGENFAGSVIVNPPGSSHQVSSPKGCIVLVIWVKPVIIAGEPAPK